MTIPVLTFSTPPYTFSYGQPVSGSHGVAGPGGGAGGVHSTEDTLLAILIVVGVGTVPTSHLDRSVAPSRTHSMCFPFVNAAASATAFSSAAAVVFL